jgi:tetratricopeptide (TPR) repeat protein
MDGHQVMTGHHFISYSRSQSEDFVAKLRSALLLESPAIRVWLDTRDIRPGWEWDEQIHEAIQTCKSLLFIMTHDSVTSDECKNEWVRALKYKKPIIPLRLERDVTLPMRLGSRQYIDFTGDFDVGVAKLHHQLQWLASSEGELRTLKDRLEDAQRDLRRAEPEERTRIQDEIDTLHEQIAHEQSVIEDPQAANTRVEKSVETGIQREREPEDPVGGVSRTKFINPPPAVAPRYFQDRRDETKLISDFLRDDALRLMTVVGRGGIGKTVVVCRLLKSVERGWLPEENANEDEQSSENNRRLSVDGIVYLRQSDPLSEGDSHGGDRGVGVPYLYADLCRFLPDDRAKELNAFYKNPQASIETKMYHLLDAFPSGRYVVLLDNFENVIDPETRQIRDAELMKALGALLEHPQHAVKVIVTTRLAPLDLPLVRPELQIRLELDKGLASPYAENILRKMDADGKLGLRTAPDNVLDEARLRTRGFPRALEALFAILAADRDTSLQEILEGTKDLMPKNVVEVLVGEAFSRLDSVAQMVMQALAIYADPVTPAAVDYLLQPYRRGVNSASVLSRLVNMQFVRREAGRRYYLHQIDRAYALSRVPKGEAADRYMIDAPSFTQFALLHRAADYLAQTRTPRESWKNIEDLAPQLQEFELRYAGQDYDTAANVLLEIDFDYLYLWGHYRLIIEMHERLQGKLSDPDLRQGSLGGLGSAYSRVGRNRESIAYYEQALEIAREIGDRQGEGTWLGNLGDTYNSLGRYQEAIAYTEQALDIARQVGDRAGEGTWLGSLGDTYNSLGRYQEAIAYTEQALSIAREIEDRANENGVLGSLGNTYSNLGRYQEAIAYYKQALEIAREIGDRQGEAVCLGNLGNPYYRMGQYHESIDYYNQALAIDREIGDLSGEATDLGNLGNNYSTLGQIDRAMECYEESLSVSREIGDRANETVHLSNLGRRYADLGQYTLANECCERSLSIAREIGSRFMESSNLYNLGNLFLVRGEWNEAVQQYKLAIQIADEIEYQQWQRGARMELARAYLYATDSFSARTTIEEARRYESEGYNYELLSLAGVIALRTEDSATAQETFQAAVAQAEAQLSYSERVYGALDAKGLALCGLALVTGDKGFVTPAMEAYRKAREITKAAGIVANVLRLFDALQEADSEGVLAGMRAVAAGSEVSSTREA